MAYFSKIYFFPCIFCRTIELTLINDCQSNANTKPLGGTAVYSRIQIIRSHTYSFERNGLLMNCFDTETYYLLKGLGFVNQYINYTK